MKLYVSATKIFFICIGIITALICAFCLYFFSHPVLYFFDTVALSHIAPTHELHKFLIVKDDDIAFLDFTSDKSECAKYVAQAYNKIFNPWWLASAMDFATFDGVFGNAWDLPVNISALEGKVYLLKPNDLKSFQFFKGDIIGAYYPLSSYIQEAKKHNCAFTHVMLVIGFINGKPVVAHQYKSPFLPGARSDRIDYLEDTTVFTHIAVMRTWRVQYLALSKE